VAVLETFEMEADDRAQAWLADRSSDRPRLIALDVHRCCGGGKLCTLSIRDASDADAGRAHAEGTLADGTRFLIDARAAARLPKHLKLTTAGFGPFQHLDLSLDGEQWGDLLYT